MELPWTRKDVTQEKITRLFKANQETILTLYQQLEQWEPPSEDLSNLQTLWATALIAVVQQKPIDDIWIALENLAQVYRQFEKPTEKSGQ